MYDGKCIKGENLDGTKGYFFSGVLVAFTNKKSVSKRVLYWDIGFISNHYGQ